MAIRWTFGTSYSKGCRVNALGFTAQGEGIEVAVAQQTVNEAISLTSAGGYTQSLTIAPPANMKSGLIVVHLSCNVANPANFTMTYGGRALNAADGVSFQTVTDTLSQVTKYLRFGRSSELANSTLVITVTGVGGGSTVLGCATVLFVEGISAAAPAIATPTLSLNAYSSSLSIATLPVGDFVVTGAAQGITASGASALDLDTNEADPDDTWTEADEDANTALTRQRVGWHFCDTSYNCDCETDPGARTLLSMRQELMVRSGYASQLTTPPPGIALLFNSYLRGAQEYLYRRYKALQTQRFFSWQMREGIRYYGLLDNAQCCVVALDKYKVTGAWLQDLNNAWHPMVWGIPPTAYTLDRNFGWPSRIEIRQCIEVFPAPQASGYKLWIKGHFGLNPFSADTDLTTIDAEPVLLWALALAKSHKGDRDAGQPTPGNETGYYGQAITYLKTLVAGAHTRKRYIPGTEPLPTMTPPVMTTWVP